MYTHAHTGTVHSIPSLGMSVMQGKVMTVDPEMRALGASAIKYDMNRLVLQAPSDRREGGEQPQNKESSVMAKKKKKLNDDK